LYNASREVWRLPGPEDPLKDFDKKCVNLRAAREGFQDGFLGSRKPFSTIYPGLAFSDALLIAAKDFKALLRFHCS
jgi:hypothetical protein